MTAQSHSFPAETEVDRLTHLIAQAEEAAQMRGVNDALIPSQVPQFQRGLDAILGLPKMRVQLKGMSR